MVMTRIVCFFGKKKKRKEKCGVGRRARVDACAVTEETNAREGMTVSLANVLCAPCAAVAFLVFLFVWGGGEGKKEICSEGAQFFKRET